jgi:hypothetical protein
LFRHRVCRHRRRGQPLEALHKTRFGQPRVGMVALTVLDIVANIQDLPVKQ